MNSSLSLDQPNNKSKEVQALREEEFNRLKRKVGELTMDLEILQTAARLRPTTLRTSDE
jgi:hypothetical protein